MAVGPRRTRRRPIGPVLLLGLLILSLGWVLYLRLTDQPLRDPFGFYQPEQTLPAAELDGRQAPVMPPAEGMVRVLMAARPIPAYSRVSRDDLFDPARRVFAYVDLEEEFVEENEVLRGTSAIVGRVLKRNKRSGFVFTEDDFLPKGTRPGLVGGIPAGMRAMRIDVGVVEGIIGLQTGDRFDIVAASKPLPPAKKADTAPVGLELTGLYSEQAQRSARSSALASTSAEPRSRVEVVVSNGVVIYPLDTRLIPTSSAGLMAGQVTGTPCPGDGDRGPDRFGGAPHGGDPPRVAAHVRRSLGARGRRSRQRDARVRSRRLRGRRRRGRRSRCAKAAGCPRATTGMGSSRSWRRSWAVSGG